MILGAQLYTLRDYCQTLKDFADTLKRVADIGYTTVQVSGTCPYEPQWLAEQLKANGLRCAITHYNPDAIKTDPTGVAAIHRVFDCQYVGIGCFPGFAEGLANFDGFVADYLPAARAIRDAGGYLMYHNHHFEFGHVEPGVTYLERMATVFPSDLLGFTLDTYWVQVGGGNPVEWIHRLSGRVPCIHLKDLVMYGTEQRMCPVGSGNLNFDAILAAAESAGTEYLLVEEDDYYDADPFEELKISYKNLKALGLS